MLRPMNPVLAPMSIVWMESAAQSAAHMAHLRSWFQREFCCTTTAATTLRTAQPNTVTTRPPCVPPASTRGRLATSTSEVTTDQLGIFSEVVTSPGIRPSYRRPLRRGGRYDRFGYDC